MKKNSKFIVFSFVVILIIVTSCTEKTSIDKLGEKVVKAIQTKDAELYYSLFPNKEQVAKYGIFAYGLRFEYENRSFWMRPFPEFLKSVDSLEKLTKPYAINQIKDMFADFHSGLSWDKAEIIKIDTLESTYEPIGNFKDRKQVLSATATMNIHLKIQDKNYVIYCSDVALIGKEGWFLSLVPKEVKLRKE
jgi:hypothetical protein